uniref:Peptidase S8/S53 domain-containing protein n=1 Tax=Hucho hucho TaxID=62062 RepID=A0A4W5KFS2_9TELE
MWYIHCTDKNNRCRSEMNILAAWQRGYTGKNVVVTILDDGIERNHPDLEQNYVSILLGSLHIVKGFVPTFLAHKLVILKTH